MLKPELYGLPANAGGEKPARFRVIGSRGFRRASNFMKAITVLVVDDHAVVREGLRNMINLEADLQVVGEAKNGREALALAMSLQPNVVLMDIAMPGLNGLEATRQVIKALPDARIIILTAHHDDAYVDRAIEAGAVGFLLKQTSAQNVCRAIHEVAAGRPYFGKSVARRIVRLQQQSAERSGADHNRPSQLTSREVEVLQLIAEGKANKETAAELGISIKTVEKHRGSLMAKLDIHDTASLTRYAISSGIIESSVQSTIDGITESSAQPDAPDDRP